MASKHFGDGFAGTTVLQTGPSEPWVSRPLLPSSYDRKAIALLLRMIAVAAAFAAVVAWLLLQLLAFVGLKQLLVLVAAGEVAFYLGWYRKRCVVAILTQFAPLRRSTSGCYARSAEQWPWGLALGSACCWRGPFTTRTGHACRPCPLTFLACVRKWLQV